MLSGRYQQPCKLHNKWNQFLEFQHVVSKNDVAKFLYVYSWHERKVHDSISQYIGVVKLGGKLNVVSNFWSRIASFVECVRLAYVQPWG
jgi:hypothetical protein